MAHEWSRSSSSSRSIASPLRSRERTVPAGSPSRRAISAALSPSRYFKSTTRRYGSASASSASRRRRSLSRTVPKSDALGKASCLAAISSRSPRRASVRFTPRSLRRMIVASQPRVLSAAGSSFAWSADRSVSWARSSASDGSLTIRRASPVSQRDSSSNRATCPVVICACPVPIVQERHR